jgi:hypothetical protein
MELKIEGECPCPPYVARGIRNPSKSGQKKKKKGNKKIKSKLQKQKVKKSK